MTTYGFRGLMLAALTILTMAPLAAQDRRERPHTPQEREEMEERFRARMGRMIQERLGLSDEDLTSLQEVTESFQEQRRSLWRSEQATRRRVEALLLEDGDDQAEARELLTRLTELRQEESRLFEEEQEALLQVLTPMQVLELRALREQISRRMRSLRGRRGGRGNVDAPIGVGLSLMHPRR